jgi:hypothetical protein
LKKIEGVQSRCSVDGRSTGRDLSRIPRVPSGLSARLTEKQGGSQSRDHPEAPSGKQPADPLFPGASEQGPSK